MSEATFEYFANATEAAVGCATSAATAAGYGYKVLNTTYTGIEAAKFAYENTAGIVNGIAGLAHLVYDNLPSYSETPQVELAGSIESSWVDAVA
ncbi:hypothetical protein [Rickettsia montanensis]|uniref:hypothetical protein n=1 Tax=Rickettsia montanensis TaxID=33991 RepID=UPI00059D1946